MENKEKGHYFEYFVKITYTGLYILDHKIKTVQNFEANKHFLKSQ